MFGLFRLNRLCLIVGLRFVDFGFVCLDLIDGLVVGLCLICL